MSTRVRQAFQSAAGAAGAGGGLNVEDVFSTYLYTGTNTTNAINNGIDLDGEGGIVWIKNRDQTDNHYIFGGESGNNWTKILSPNGNGYYGGATNIFDSVSSTGFTVKSDFGGVNTNGEDYASWTWRKAPRFFDCVTYTGNGTTNRQISHNLGSVPGCIIVKRTNGLKDWAVYHRGKGSTHYGTLNTTEPFYDYHTWWQDTDPTSTDFTVGNSAFVNANGDNYVAYLFAHNDGDGEFGPTGDQDIIKCGSYTGNSNGEYDDNGTEINLGFEPQWVLIKSSTWGSGNWQIYDTMRGITARPTASSRDGADAVLYPNQSYAESGGNSFLRVTPTGFKLESDSYSVNASIHDYIYIAIRRGPMAVPESATDVFGVKDRYSEGSLPTWQSGFVTDMAMRKRTSGSDSYIYDRLRQGKELAANSTSSEATTGNSNFDYMTGWGDIASASSGDYGWNWKRAPNFFDAVAYTGNGTAGHTVSHNLGVAPEMMWVKCRNTTLNWSVYHKYTTATDLLRLNATNATQTVSSVWNDTEPTSTQFTVGTSGTTNDNTNTYIAYLFASLDGVSKVGSYSGDGTNGRVVDCGFSSGARFILHKCTSHAGNWFVFDSERGIVAGNDPRLWLNTTDAEVTNGDFIDPHSSGFIVNNTYGDLNDTGRDYIFYAVA